ncbi:hypothetical protein [Paenibacillus cremeus]|uniref:Uncharacterized protein n=1 Tax=Paenibacillus cremeus TaxID=2163881 RepID=A0A559KCZ0_9BACL|nr:hypothetical protein [Paenibacillus cremeus]TVY09959.1 hypothetical protein FPZ49_11350 [Paenibacillus cremeus]
MKEGGNMARPKGSSAKDKLVIEKIKCKGKCGKEKAPTNFYINTNPLFSSEKLEVCKDCISEYIGTKSSSGYLNRVKLVLGLMDKPFLYDLWISRDEDWGRYIPQLSSFPQYKGLTNADSTFTDKKINTENPNESFVLNSSPSSYTSEEISELSSFWGKNYTPDELEYLQTQYEKFLNSYECDSYAMELLFQEASQQRLTINKLRQEGKSVDKELKTLQDLLGSANVKPVQETGANATEQATFGTLIKKYENERPIPEPDEAWKDVDGIKRYIQVWFLGHLCRMIGINNDYSRLYDEEIAKYTVDPPKYDDDISEEVTV